MNYNEPSSGAGRVTIETVPPTAANAAALSVIARRAKASWNYPAHWLELWRDQLTVSPAKIATGHLFAARLDRRWVGFYSLSFDGELASLEDMWVLPEAGGQGVGRALFQHAVASARTAGATETGDRGRSQRGGLLPPHGRNAGRRAGLSVGGRAQGLAPVAPVAD